MLPGGSAPDPPPQDHQDPWISPAVAFPFPLAFVAEPSYTYIVPFNLPACQLFQPSHYFYGSSLSSCQLSGSGLAERGGPGLAPHVPPQCRPSSSLCFISRYINFAVFPCCNPFLAFLTCSSPVLKKSFLLCEADFLFSVNFKEMPLKSFLADPLWTAVLWVYPILWDKPSGGQGKQILVACPELHRSLGHRFEFAADQPHSGCGMLVEALH